MVNSWPDYVLKTNGLMAPPTFVEFLWSTLLKHPEAICMIYGPPIVLLAVLYNCLSLQLFVLSTQVLCTFLEVLELYERWGEWGRDPLLGLLLRYSLSIACLIPSFIGLVAWVGWVVLNEGRKR